MNNGFVKLHRSIQSNPEWLSESFTRSQAWIDLILLANHKPGFVRIAGRRIDVGRGQLAWSVVNLANRWRWSKGKVFRSLNEWRNDGRLDHQNIIVTTLITITNYDRYQTVESPYESPDESPDRTPDESPDGHLMDHKQEGKEGTRIRSTPSIPQGGLFGDEQAEAQMVTKRKSEENEAKRRFSDRICAIMHRGAKTKWSDKERKALNKIFPAPEEDISAIEAYYSATIPTQDYRRKEVATLLNNWPGEVDRAKKFIERNGHNNTEGGNDGWGA